MTKITELPRKQYKHKITKDIITQSNDGVSYFYGIIANYKYSLPKCIVEDSNDWEIIKEEKKDYEILSLQYLKPDCCLYSFKKGEIIPCKFEQGEYKFKTHKDTWDFYGNGGHINTEVFNIYSIKRLSDGKIFTIGNTIKHPKETTNHTIFSIEIGILDKEVHLNVNKQKHFLFLQESVKVIKKTPLFTTEQQNEIISLIKLFI